MTGSSNLTPRELRANDNKVVEGSDKADEMIRNLSKSKKSKNAISEIPTCINIGAIGESIFLTSNAKKAFN